METGPHLLLSDHRDDFHHVKALCASEQTEVQATEESHPLHALVVSILRSLMGSLSGMSRFASLWRKFFTQHLVTSASTKIILLGTVAPQPLTLMFVTAFTHSISARHLHGHAP